MKVIPAAVKTDWEGRTRVSAPRSRVPAGPRETRVPSVVRARPPGVREVLPMEKPEGCGANVIPAAVKMDAVAVGGGGDGMARVEEPAGPAARMPALEGRAE